MEIKKNSAVRWIDVAKPTEEDLTWLEKKFGLHPLIVEELRQPSARARVEIYKNYLYFIYYFPLYNTKEEASVRSEIDFIITKDTVVTVHYESLRNTLENFQIDDVESSLKLLCHMIEHLTIFEERQLRHIREKVEMIGRELFNGKEKEVLERITYLKRDISEYRISVRLQEPILKSLLMKGTKFWDGDAEIYLSELVGEQLKVVTQIQDYRETISDFEETNNQLMNLKINTVMKSLTSLSFIAFPAIFLGELFTMNTRDTPIVGLPHAFWIVTGIMAALMLTLFVYFKKKGWL